MTYLPAATTLTVTFDEARARAAAAGRNTRRPITASTSATPGRAGPCDWVVDKATGEVLIEVDPRYFRPTEVDALLGDPSKARAKLGWHHKTSFDKLVAEMVQADLLTVRDERERRNRYG